MATLPTTPVPTWATSFSAEITYPGDDKVDLGWETAKKNDGTLLPYGEAPPFQWFNYIMNNYGQWFEYLEEAIEESKTTVVSSTNARITGISTTLPVLLEYDFRQTTFMLFHRFPDLPIFKGGQIKFYKNKFDSPFTEGFSYNPASGSINIDKKGLLTIRVEEDESEIGKFQGRSEFRATFTGGSLVSPSITNGYTFNFFTGINLKGSSVIANESIDTVCLENSISPYPLKNMVAVNNQITLFDYGHPGFTFYVYVNAGDEIKIYPSIGIQDNTIRSRTDKLKISLLANAINQLERKKQVFLSLQHE